MPRFYEQIFNRLTIDLTINPNKWTDRVLGNKVLGLNQIQAAILLLTVGLAVGFSSFIFSEQNYKAEQKAMRIIYDKQIAIITHCATRIRNNPSVIHTVIISSFYLAFAIVPLVMYRNITQEEEIKFCKYELQG